MGLVCVEGSAGKLNDTDRTIRVLPILRDPISSLQATVETLTKSFATCVIGCTFTPLAGCGSSACLIRPLPDH